MKVSEERGLRIIFVGLANTRINRRLKKFIMSFVTYSHHKVVF
jgi:hypothetical protein